MGSEVDDKGFVPDEFRTTIYRRLRARPDNRTCFDCPARNPTWISLSHGVYVCLVCSGEHRRMGVHISFVRSIELDSFSKDQLAVMAMGGNGKARQYYKALGIGGKRKDAEKGSRAVDYYDKSSGKLRLQLERETVNACREHDIPTVNIEKSTFTGTIGSKVPLPPPPLVSSTASNAPP